MNASDENMLNSLPHINATYIKNTGKGICPFLSISDAIKAYNGNIASGKSEGENVVASLRRSSRVNPATQRCGVF